MRKSFSARNWGLYSLTLISILFFSGSLMSQCSSGNVEGQVYLDANNNGALNAAETGYAGVMIRAYDASGTWVGQSVSDASGAFSISGLSDGSDYRLEFSNTNSYQSAILGQDNGGDVQFVTAPFCQAHLGLIDGSGSCDAATEVYLSCFVNELGATGPNQETIIGLTNSFNASSPVNVYARHSETGAVWGMALKESTQELFSSAFVKQHSSLGPGGLGAIYLTNITNPSTSVYASLPSLGINVGSLSSANAGNCAYGDQVGKIGLGGLTIDDAGNNLFVANLYSNTIVKLSSSNPTASSTSSFQVPDPGCSDGDYRVFGLTYHAGSLYVGVTCTAETSNDEDDTSIHVYEMNATSGSATLVFSSDYTRGFWSNTQVDNRATMQWLTDLDFTNDGKMILALSDRLGHSYCNTGSSRLDDQFGDILIAENINGSWVLENNGSISTGAGTGVGNGQGPGGGEFFGADYFPGNPSDHPEVALGSVYVRPGSNEVIAAVFDPSLSAYSGGLHRYSTTTGQKVGVRELYNQNIAEYFGKATGFGDIHTGCAPTAPQIGNFVWIDNDCDGVQDAGEPALAYADVYLYDAQCNQVASTQTDQNGNYNFNQGLQLGVQYYLALDPSAFDNGVSAYNLNNVIYTPTTYSGASHLDSDLVFGQFCPSLNGVPVASVIPQGPNNLTFDLGLKPATDFDLACRKINLTPSKSEFGDIIEFEIEIYNQGSVAATNYEIVDYLTPAYGFDPVINNGWILDGTMAKKMINSTLLPGQTHVETIKLELVGSEDLDDFINYAEISYTMDANGVQNSDVDSTTDDDATNDVGGLVATTTDDVITGVAILDEDDHDPAMVYFADLALSKVNRDNRTYFAGEVVTFDITITNQGNVDVESFEVVDSYPTGLTFVSSLNQGWVGVNSNLLKYSYDQVLAVGEQVELSVRFKIGDASEGVDLMNYAEIASFASSRPEITADFDSTPDSDMLNDIGGDPYNSTNNMINDHAIIDEDDHDPAGVTIRAIDLALIKTVDQTTYNLGDEVTYNIEIHNQGSETIGKVQLVDFLPSGMTLVDQSWSLDAAGVRAFKMVHFANGLAMGDVHIETIRLRINSSAPKGAFLNYAEISEIYNTNNEDVSRSDIDSHADALMGNDAGGMPMTSMDDYLLGDGADDEDDSDPAVVFVPTITLSESCVCLNNATNPFDGQYREQIMITSVSGETWYIDSEFEFYDLASGPGAPVSYATGPGGKLFSQSSNGDGTSSYFLTGKSIDGTPFSLRATNGAGIYLTITGGDCDSVTPTVTGDGLGAVCANSTHTYSVDTSDPAFENCVDFTWYLVGNAAGGGTIVNMPGTNVTGSGSGMVGTGTGPGNSITIEWGAGNGPHELILLPNCPDECVTPVVLEVEVGMGDGAMSCIHELNVSLDNGCQSSFEAEDFLTSPVMAGVAYQLIMTDAYGNLIQENIVTEEHLWTSIMAKVMNPCTGNSCWANVHIEDKLAPRIQCDDIVINCFDINSYEPIVVDNCSTSSYELVGETTTALPCSAPFIAEMYRTYVAEDGYGNVSAPCTQKINIAPIDLDAIAIPDDLTVVDENALSCMGLELDENGNPAPSMTGVPTINNKPLFPVSDYHCNIGVDYRDVVVADFGCSKKIMRTWTVYDGCNEPLRRVQTIEIADVRAPWVDCPANVTINTDGSPGCDAEYTIPLPQITDDCTVDNFRIDVTYSGGFIQNLDAATSVVVSSADGSAITYNVYDECGNLSTCTHNVTVLDNVSPTAVCDGSSVVSLRLDGTAKAFPQTFDDGSYDDCNLFKTLVRRMDSPCDCDRPKFDDMKFLGERNGRYYYISSFDRTCLKAASLATAYGGSLLTLESEEEHDWVYEQVTDYLPGASYYIGLKDKSGNGDFTWDNHAEPDFNIWSGGAPTDAGECVVVNDAGEWEVVGDLETRFVLEVANPCGFSEEVAFCCADVGENSMVVLRAIDYFGGFNDCMVNVEVQDKVPPVLSCPDNIVLDCAAVVDLNNLLEYGEATASDVCIVNIVPEVIDERDQCGTGTIIRRFVASDASGVSSCDQIISFENDEPFDFDEIIRPEDFDTDLGCNFGLLHPDNLPVENAYPIYPTDACDIVEGIFEDQVFSFAGTGADACLKILRTWTVIDWCQVDADGLPLSVSFDQTIKVQNTAGPEIVSGQCDSLVVTTLECDNADVSFSVTANDDCTPGEQLQNCLRIDFNNDGTFDFEDCLVSNTVSFNNKLPVGSHTALISFSDLCGNTTTCSKPIVIKNEKPPVAYCKSGLSVALEPMDLDGDGVPDDEMACIFPHMLDLGSEHPCGNNFGISFCNNDPTNKITFDCTDIGTQIVTLCVIDEFGNSASCQTSIEVQDNNDEDFCPEFDLALLKEIVDEQPEYNAGDTVKFRMTVFNQGNIDAIDTRLIDYIPEGLEFIPGLNPGWTGPDANGDVSYNTMPTIPANPFDVPGINDFEIVCIYLRIAPNTMETCLVNTVEISASGNPAFPTYPDLDSNADNIESNDTVKDNFLNEDGSNFPDQDEDDHDISKVNIRQVYDLALTKEITSGFVGPYAPGDAVNYTITITNEGTLDATTVDVQDNIPAGLILNDADWSLVGGNAVLNNSIPFIGVGTSQSVDITFTIDPLFMGDSILNDAQIIDRDGSDPVDIDSSTATDKGVDEDGDGNGDDDDEDSAMITLTQVFDLALTKSISAGGPALYQTGEVVSFDITVFNQGSLDASNVVVTDYVRANLIYNQSLGNNASNGWTAATNPTNTIGFIPAGGSETVAISLMIDPEFTGAMLINDAEITNATNVLGLPDEDSSPNDNSNTPSETGTDGDIGDAPDNPNDNDDYDPALVMVDCTLEPICNVIPSLEVSLDSDGNASITAAMIDNGSEATCDGLNVTLALSQTSFDCSDKGNGNVVTVTVTDDQGNVSNDPTCTTTITVVDEINPTITCQGISTTLDSNGDPIVDLNDVVVASGDNCTIVSTELFLPSIIDECGANNSTVVVTDQCGNTGSCNFDITIAELEPICNILSAVTINLDANGVATLDPSEVDNGSTSACGVLTVNLSLSQTTFDCDDKGSGNIVTLTVTDTEGNTYSGDDCISDITVVDEIDPTITCMGITTTLDGNGDPIINLSDVIVSSGDNCSIVSTELTPPASVDICDVNPASITVTDQCGNTASCTFDVSIQDQAPVANCVPAFDLCLDANGTASLTANDIDNGSTDDCGIAQLAINQMNFDCDDVGPNVIMLSVFD